MSESAFADAVKALDAGVVVHAADTSILEVNDRARELLGIFDAKGRPTNDPDWVFLDEDLSPLPRESFPEVLALAGERVRNRLVGVRRPDGLLLWGEVGALPRLDATGELVDVLVTILDVTERETRRRDAQALNERLNRLALTDPLTGVSNRRGILQEAERAHASAVRRGEPLAFVVVDLDGFKAVNDRHGHERGDELLRAVADCLRRELRAEDAVGRLGGDEFLIILPRTPGCDTEKFAERVRASARLCGGTASFGAVCLRQGESVEQLIHRADQAMYRAKAAGGNTVVLGPLG